MSKQYGLIHPKKESAPKFVKLSAFDSDSDSDTTASTSKKPNVNISLLQKRQVARTHNAALTEDPTIFQYDELYDDIKTERQVAKDVKKTEQKNVKYIGKLLESADRRKKEYERRIERQVQKERETEGEMYKDKEAFVTSSYKLKLEEMRKAEEEEKRFDYLESIGDVTKQRDLGGFYRHLYEQKMGPNVSADEKKTKTDAPTNSLSVDDKVQEKMDNKQVTKDVKKERVYRKRKSSAQETSDDEESTGVDSRSIVKKAHLQSNLDADSDFSIDSESDEEKNEKSESATRQPTDVPSRNQSTTISTKNQTETEKEPVVEVETATNDDKKENDDKHIDNTEVETKKPPKVDKTKIWEKRTVGEVFVAAVQRYFERKLLRERNA